jgi:hypothetical protein
MKRRRFRGARAVALLAVALSGCGGGDAQRIVSHAPPNTPIVLYPSSFDRRSTTVIESAPSTRQAGVKGNALTVTTYHGALPFADELTIDAEGNVGVRGSIRAQGSIATVSHRSQKTDIRTFDEDPLALLRATTIVSYRYATEAADHDRHIGFIAEDTPSELSGAAHDRYDVTNTLAVDVAATQKLERTIIALERKVRILEARLRASRAASVRR